MLRLPPSSVTTAAAAAAAAGRPSFVVLSTRTTPPRATPARPLPVSPPPPASCRLAPPFRSTSLLRCTAREEATVETVDEGKGSSVDRDAAEERGSEIKELGVAIGMMSPSFRMSAGDRGFLLFSFVALTTSIAFTSMVVAAVPALLAMRRTAISFAKLADTAREELPSTMAAIRLSGMEISDLTIELSDLSQEIADGVTKSAQAVQAAEAGVRQIGALARQKTMSMIEERANLPDITLKPVVAGAARKTSLVAGQAKKTFINIFSRGESNMECLDRVED